MAWTLYRGPKEEAQPQRDCVVYLLEALRAHQFFW